MASHPLRAGSPQCQSQGLGQQGAVTRQARKRARLRTRASGLVALGTAGYCCLTFLILLLLLSTSPKQGKDDACLGVHTNGCHHHSSRTFHDMSAWHSNTQRLRQRSGWEAYSAPTGLSWAFQEQGLRSRWAHLTAAWGLCLPTCARGPTRPSGSSRQS